jgi:hypothetical protein
MVLKEAGFYDFENLVFGRVVQQLLLLAVGFI